MNPTPQDASPAGGAELAEAVGATTAAVLLTTALLVLGIGHRSGRIPLLGRLAAFSSRLSGLPGWAALPAAVATGSLLAAVLGLYWDVSLHIDNGRDPGPLANPSHYFILFGLFGIFTAGWLAIVLPEGRPGPAAIRIARDWYAPVSGVMMMGCASFALLGFPLDDVSHRLFGQDVTLWGPTHLMMLGGAGLSLIAMLGLLVEGRLASREGGRRTGQRALLGGPVARTIRLVSACGGLLIGLSIFQGEFDFGVPQFRLLFHPVLIALAASLALVAARTLAGRGAALGAVGFYLVVRGGLSLIVGPGFGETTPHFPLYIAEALIVEAVALRATPERLYRFGALAGALVGSIGVLAEWGWSHVWMPHPWPDHIVGEAIALSVPVAVAGGVLGAFLGGALRLRADAVATPRAWAAAAASLLVVAGAFAYLLPTKVPEGARATVTLTEVRAAPEREVQATVRFDPPSAASDADWLTGIAWQGEDKLIVEPLREVGGGIYRTTAPLPVHGSWKSSIRLQRGGEMASVPVFLPGDAAIPAAEVPAPARFERALIADHEILQRERKDDVPGWLWAAAGATVLGLSLALIALLGWGLVRVAAAGSRTPPPRRAPRAAPGPRPARTPAGVTS